MGGWVGGWFTFTSLMRLMTLRATGAGGKEEEWVGGWFTFTSLIKWMSLRATGAGLTTSLQAVSKEKEESFNFLSRSLSTQRGRRRRVAAL